MKRRKKDYEPLEAVVRQLNELRGKQTIEQWAYGHDINKATLSRLLKGHNKDARISTLVAICRSLGLKLKLKIEK
jgi:DNA-binding Xre family transcriptional regulator